MTMIVRGMRWGYDGGGFACGPVEGNTLVEIMVKGNDNLHHYVFVSRMSEFEQIRITSMPVFDIAMWMDRSKVDSDAEWKKIEDVTEEMYDYEIYEPDKDMRKSQYVKAIDLARAAMVECYGSEDQSAKAANAFIEEYCDEDIDKMDIPEVIERDEDEEYEYEDDPEEDIKDNNEIKVIGSNVATSNDMESSGVIAEMEIMDGNQKVILLAYWNDLSSDTVQFSRIPESVFKYDVDPLSDDYEKVTDIIQAGTEDADDLHKLEGTRYYEQYKLLYYILKVRVEKEGLHKFFKEAEVINE